VTARSTPSAASRPAVARPRGGGPSVLGHGDLWTSLILIFPLFLAYEIGVAFSPVMNGVDFISRNLFALVGYSRRNYLIVHAVLAVVFVILLLVLRRRRSARRLRVLSVFLESGIYALTLGSLIVFAMRRLLGIEPSLAVGKDAATNVLLSLGAGVHEELVFRLGACAGSAAIMRLIGATHAAAVVTGFVVSAALFSAAHHLGAQGDPWSWNLFVYRALAGLLFATIFYYRSLAHAAYTHAFYDIYVMLIR
jgi:CAAX prenyl protease-like protein